jgi:hypothetical protein
LLIVEGRMRRADHLRMINEQKIEERGEEQPCVIREGIPCVVKDAVIHDDWRL